MPEPYPGLFDAYPKPPDAPDEAVPACSLCGCEMEWERCGACDGDGYEDWETLQFEDPLWYQPGDTRRCEECKGDGGWWQCPNVPHDIALPRYEDA